MFVYVFGFYSAELNAGVCVFAGIQFLKYVHKGKH